MTNWDNAPTILIFGDSDEGLAAASEAANANGGRIAAALPVTEAAERLDRQIAVDLVMLDVSADHGPLLDELIRLIGDGSNARRFAGIVTISPALVDIASARLGNGEVKLLVGRSRERLTRAIAQQLSGGRLQLAENGNGKKGRSRASANNDGRADGDGDDMMSSEVAAMVAEANDAPDPHIVRGIIRARRLRSQFFGQDLFADPAWDILLDLLIARTEGRSVAVSSLCIAAAVPATTALRWIKQLTDADLLRRVADPLDGRRVFIELTDNAVATLTAYFTALMRGIRSN